MDGGFKPSKYASWILLNSFKCALAMLVLGVGGGLMVALWCGPSYLSSFGAITIALGVWGFGIVAGDLLNRAQDAYFGRENDMPTDPFAPSNIRRTLNFQTLVVVVGTLQSGFGNQIMGI